MSATAGRTQQRESHAMSEGYDDEGTVIGEKASVKSLDLVKAKNEVPRRWSLLFSARDKALPISSRHLMLILALLLASTASRLETSPRTQIYAEIINDSVNLGACSGGYVAVDYPVPSQTGDIVNAVDGYGGTIVQVSQPTPAVGPSFGRRQFPEPTVTTTAVPTEAPSTVPFVTATAVMGTPTYSPSGSAAGYISCSNENRGAWVITNLVPWFTAAIWAAVSDRVGRRPILVLSTVGIMIANLPIAITSPMHGARNQQPGADHLILAFGAIFHSLLGGFLTTIAVSLAYLVDTTTSWDRTIVTGFGLAVLYLGNFTGAAIPVHSLGLKWTFATSIIIQAIYVLFVVLVLPESLSAENRQGAKDRRLALQLQESPSRVKSYAKTFAAVILPITVFFPTRTGDGTLQRPGRKWDFNVFLLSVAFGVGAMMMDGAYFFGPLTIWPSGGDQYSIYWFIPRWRTYSWTWYPLVRGLILLFVTPAVIAIMRLKPWESLAKRLFDNDPEAQVDREALMVGNTTLDSQKVDHNVARFTTIWTVFLQSTLAYAYPYGSNEKVISIVGALGAPFMPTLISLISVLYMNNGDTEIGRLMGGLVFLQAALGQGLGKWIFSVAYGKWYTSFAPGAYYLATGLMGLLLLVFSLVKLPKFSYLQ